MTLIEVPPVTQTLIAAIADLTQCVCEELSTGGGGPPCWCGLYPGQAVSWDYCGDCGQDTCGMGYVRVAGVFPYSTFPEPLLDTRCERPLAWMMEVGALRCVPTPPDGSLLDVATMADVGVTQILDAAALYRAIKCCAVDTAVDTYFPVGPTGGCVGGFWRAFAAVE